MFCGQMIVIGLQRGLNAELEIQITADVDVNTLVFRIISFDMLSHTVILVVGLTVYQISLVQQRFNHLFFRPRPY
jgi:hypothetical protein